MPAFKASMNNNLLAHGTRKRTIIITMWIPSNQDNNKENIQLSLILGVESYQESNKESIQLYHWWEFNLNVSNSAITAIILFWIQREQKTQKDVDRPPPPPSSHNAEQHCDLRGSH